MVFRRKQIDWANKVDIITIRSHLSSQAKQLTGAVCVHWSSAQCAGVLRLRGCCRTDGGLDTEDQAEWRLGLGGAGHCRQHEDT